MVYSQLRVFVHIQWAEKPPGELYSNVSLQHSLRVGIARAHTIEDRVALWIEYTA
jgi:hypothetical protein